MTFFVTRYPGGKSCHQEGLWLVAVEGVIAGWMLAGPPTGQTDPWAVIGAPAVPDPGPGGNTGAGAARFGCCAAPGQRAAGRDHSDPWRPTTVAPIWSQYGRM